MNDTAIAPVDGCAVGGGSYRSSQPRQQDVLGQHIGFTAEQGDGDANHMLLNPFGCLRPAPGGDAWALQFTPWYGACMSVRITTSSIWLQRRQFGDVRQVLFQDARELWLFGQSVVVQRYYCQPCFHNSVCR